MRMRITDLILLISIMSCASAPTLDPTQPVKAWPFPVQPMYGDSVNDPEVKKANDWFVAQQIKSANGDKAAVLEHLLMRGWEFFFENNYNKAMRRFNQAWLIDPNDYRPYWGMAAILYKMAYYDEAIPLYETATKLDKKDYKLYFNYALVFVKKSYKRSKDDDLGRASDLLSKSIELKSDYDESHFRLAEVFTNQSRYKEAWREIKIIRKLGKVSEFVESNLPQLVAIIEKNLPEPK